MKDRHFIILLVLAAGVYVYFFGIPERPTQATGNPLTRPTTALVIDTSAPAVIIVTATPTPQTHQPEVILIPPAATATQAPTATPYPTYTAVPVQTIGDYGLPGMGPYTLDQVNQCRDIITSGNLHTLQSPQRELCVQYVGAGN